MADESYLSALSALQALCSKRECCSSDIKKKALARLEGNEQKAQELVRQLIEDRFLDDSRYAAFFARDKAALNGWGPIKIRYALRMKQIPDTIINSALEEIDSAKADTKLRRILADKWSKLEGDPYAKFKLTRFALSRGYDYEAIRPLVEDLSKQA